MDLTIQNDSGKFNKITAISGFQKAPNGEEQATVYKLYMKIVRKVKESVFFSDNNMRNQDKQQSLIDRLDKWSYKKVFAFFNIFGDVYEQFCPEELRKSILKVSNMRTCDNRNEYKKPVDIDTDTETEMDMEGNIEDGIEGDIEISKNNTESYYEY